MVGVPGVADEGVATESASRSATTADWPQRNLDAANARSKLGGVGSRATPGTTWTADPGERPYAAPAAVSGTIYASGRRGVHALDAADGSVEWRYQPVDGVEAWTSPAVVDDTAYVGEAAIPTGSHEKTLHVRALDVRDGSERWRGRAVQSAAVTSVAPPVATSDAVYYGRSVLDAKSGDERRTRRAGTASPVVTSEALYTGGDAVRAID